MEISSGPPARNVFSVPFLFGTKPLATLPTDLLLLGKVVKYKVSVVNVRYLILCYKPKHLSNCSYDDVPSSFLSLLISAAKYNSFNLVGADVDEFSFNHTVHEVGRS